MSWIVYFHGDRAKLNERPIFFACYMFTLALHQTARHYLIDIDYLPLTRVPGEDELPEGVDPSDPLKALLYRFPKYLLGVVTRGFLNFAYTLVLYHLILRRFAWGWALMFFRPFYNLPKTNMVPPSAPFHTVSISQCLYASVLLGLLWEISNAAFTAYMTKAPLKNGKPLTVDSKDPNGSLLNGLKSKKPSIKVCQTFHVGRSAPLIEILGICHVGARQYR